MAKVHECYDGGCPDCYDDAEAAMVCKECQGEGWVDDNGCRVLCTALDCSAEADLRAGSARVLARLCGPVCEGCNLHRATFWWGVTGIHQCAQCHAEGEAAILAREAAEAAAQCNGCKRNAGKVEAVWLCSCP